MASQVQKESESTSVSQLPRKEYSPSLVASPYEIPVPTIVSGRTFRTHTTGHESKMSASGPLHRPRIRTVCTSPRPPPPPPPRSQRNFTRSPVQKQTSDTTAVARPPRPAVRPKPVGYRSPEHSVSKSPVQATSVTARAPKPDLPSKANVSPAARALHKPLAVSQSTPLAVTQPQPHRPSLPHVVTHYQPHSNQEDDSEDDEGERVYSQIDDEDGGDENYSAVLDPADIVDDDGDPLQEDYVIMSVDSHSPSHSPHPPPPNFQPTRLLQSVSQQSFLTPSPPLHHSVSAGSLQNSTSSLNVEDEEEYTEMSANYNTSDLEESIYEPIDCTRPIPPPRRKRKKNKTIHGSTSISSSHNKHPSAHTKS